MFCWYILDTVRFRCSVKVIILIYQQCFVITFVIDLDSVVWEVSYLSLMLFPLTFVVWRLCFIANLFLGNIHRFKKLRSTLSSTSAELAVVKTKIEKGLCFKVLNRILLEYWQCFLSKYVKKKKELLIHHFVQIFGNRKSYIINNIIIL